MLWNPVNIRLIPKYLTYSCFWASICIEIGNNRQHILTNKKFLILFYMLLLCLQGKHFTLLCANIHISASVFMLIHLFFSEILCLFSVCYKKEDFIRKHLPDRHFSPNHSTIVIVSCSNSIVLICYILHSILTIGNLKQTNEFIEEIKANVFF